MKGRLKNKIKLEKPGGRYCNLDNPVCKKYGKVYTDDHGYICAKCGGRVSKWLPLTMAIETISIDPDGEKPSQGS